MVPSPNRSPTCLGTQSAAAVLYKTAMGGIASSVMRCHCPSASFMAPSALLWTALAAVTRQHELRLRLVDPKALNPDTIMPAYHRVEGFHRVHERYGGKPILTAQQIEDVVAYLLTLQSP